MARPLAYLTLLLLLLTPTRAAANHPFTNNSGIDHTAPYTVTCHPDQQARTPDCGINWWNLHTNRRLLIPVQTGGTITILPDATPNSAWTEVRPDKQPTWNTCTIHANTHQTAILTHELGHCLGLSGHLHQATYDSHPIFAAYNMAVCNNPEHHAYSPYRGLMSACGTYTPSGEDRYQFSTERTGPTVSIVSGLNWPDALVAPRPILYVNHTVPDATWRALERLQPSHVVIYGGTAAVSAAVEQQLVDAAYNVSRIAGRDRYETAEAAA